MYTWRSCLMATVLGWKECDWPDNSSLWSCRGISVIIFSESCVLPLSVLPWIINNSETKPFQSHFVYPLGKQGYTERCSIRDVFPSQLLAVWCRRALSIQVPGSAAYLLVVHRKGSPLPWVQDSLSSPVLLTDFWEDQVRWLWKKIRGHQALYHCVICFRVNQLSTEM